MFLPGKYRQEGIKSETMKGLRSRNANNTVFPHRQYNKVKQSQEEEDSQPPFITYQDELKEGQSVEEKQAHAKFHG